MCVASNISIGKNPLIDHLGHCPTSDINLVVDQVGMYYFHKDPEWLESRSETKAQIPADCAARDTI